MVGSVYDYLTQVRMLDELITAKVAEREQLIALATKVTQTSDGMPRGNGGVSDKVGSITAKLVDLEEETNGLIDKYIEYKQQVIRTLELLPHDEYCVLHKHYVQYKTWKVIAREMDYSRSQVWRYKNAALAHLSEILQWDETQ